MEIKTSIMNSKIIKININKISLDKNIPHKKINEAEIIALASNIKKNGLFYPLSVRKYIKDREKYILVSGYRRYLALKFLNVIRVPVIVYSLTEAEAEIFYLCDEINRKNLTIFEKAIAIKKMLIKGRLSRQEIAEYISISTQKIDRILSVLELDKFMRQTIINNSFSEEFIYTFLKVSEEKRADILNYIIANKLTNDTAIKYIEDYLTPKKEPIKTVCITNDKIILNSLERIAENLNSSGIDANIDKKSYDNKTEYILTIEKRLKQLTLL